MFSTTTRYTGTSGIDVTGMVDAMMQAESLKYNKLNQNVEYMKWQQEAGRTMGNQVKDFQKSFLSLGSPNSIRTSGTFTSRSTSVTSSGTGTIGVKPKNNVKPGTYTVDVKNNATNEVRQGTPVAKSQDIVGTEKMDAAKLSEINVGDSFSINYDGTTTKFSFTEDDVNKLRSATDDNAADTLATVMNDKLKAKYGMYAGEQKVGVEANADGTLSIKVPESLGVAVSLGTSDAVTNNTITSNTAIPKPGQTFTKAQEGTHVYQIGDGPDSLVSIDVTAGMTNEDYMSQLQAGVDKALETEGYGAGYIKVGQDANGKVTFTSTEDSSVPKKAPINIAAEYRTYQLDGDGNRVKDEFGNDVTTNKMAIGSKTEAGGFKGVALQSSTQTHGTEFFGVDAAHNSNKLNTSKMTLADMGITADTSLTINGKTINVKATDTIDQFMSNVNKSGADVTMSFNKNSNSFTLQGNSTGSINEINVSAGENVLAAFGLDKSDDDQKATDAQITVNGENVVRDGNKFTYNDIEFDLTEAKAGETYTVKIEGDTSGTMDSIKSFVDAYNSMITGLQDATNTTRAKSGSYSYYQPLTDEEKDAMTDKEIETWEANAKKGLLYNDPEFNRLTRDLRSAMSSSVKLADGSSISLASIGITTEGWETGGKLVIDEDKLQKALEERPDDVKTLFTQTGTGIGDKLDKAVTSAVGSNGYISHKYGFEGTVLVNENEMSKKIKASNEELDALKISLAAKEDHYYTMFAAMENAVNEANSQMSYLMSISG